MQFVGTTPYLYYIDNLVLWYLGPALGITACIGLLFAGYRALSGELRDEHIVLLLWVVPYFLVVGRFWAKFGRYLLPIIPLLTLFAAALLVFLVRRLPGRWRSVGSVVMAMVIISTVGWAIAFEHIYSTTNTQVAASRWIYRHLPPGTPFATEGAWDRSLPLCLPQPNECPSGYKSFQLNLYSPDNKQKLARLVHALNHDKLIVMSSPRMLDSIPRMPSTYPLTNRYYRLLFSGALDFRLAKQFVVRPQIGPWVIDDAKADEDFQIFDHPEVRIFERTRRMTPGSIRRILMGEPSGSGGLLSSQFVRRTHPRLYSLRDNSGSIGAGVRLPAAESIFV